MQCKPRVARRHVCLLGVVLMVAGGLPVWAQTAATPVPRPAEFYFDEDSATRPLATVEPGDEAAIARLVREMERGGRHAEQATAQLAQLSMASGRTETGLALYAKALAATSGGGARQRTLLWNQAWDLYRSGDVAAALPLWVQAAGDRVVRPAWVPPTLALALWKLDRRDEAVVWYAAAVRTYPDRWSDPAALETLLPDWSDDDRATLAEVLAAWRQAPPAWP